MPSDTTGSLDDLDSRLLLTLRAHPRVGLLEVARRLGVARGTVQARLEKLRARGVITGFGPEVDPARMGFPVLAFVFLEIAQGRLGEAVEALRAEPQVLEAHGVTGAQDLLCRVVARDNGDLQDVINRMVAHPAVQRSTSAIAMSSQIPWRIEALVAAGRGPERPSAADRGPERVSAAGRGPERPSAARRGGSLRDRA